MAADKAMRLTALWLLLFLTAFPIFPKPQSENLTLSGHVTDAQSGRPVIGATINVVGNEGSPTTTDTDGTFVVTLAKGVTPSSKVRIRVEKPGYQIWDKLIAVNSTLPIRVEMSPALHKVQPAATSGKKAPATIQQSNSGGSNTQQVTTGPNSPIINNPLPAITLDHRGNLQVKGTPIIGRDSSGFDLTARINLWNAGEYEIKPMALVIMCLFASPVLGPEQVQVFANQSFVELGHRGCRVSSQFQNAIEPKSEYPETIEIAHNMWMDTKALTDGIANHSLVVYLFVQAYYRDSLSDDSAPEILHTKYCRYFWGADQQPVPCLFGGDGISIAKSLQ